jgi:hypothetical protein
MSYTDKYLAPGERARLDGPSGYGPMMSSYYSTVTVPSAQAFEYQADSSRTEATSCDESPAHSSGIRGKLKDDTRDALLGAAIVAVGGAIYAAARNENVRSRLRGLRERCVAAYRKARTGQ